MQTLLLGQQDGETLVSIQTLDENRLLEGDATVDAHRPSLNYKDALAITGKGRIIRNLPMIPGIDLAGTIRTSENSYFHAGQEVSLIGWGVGENHQGGLAEQTRVKGDWLVAMLQGLDARKAVIIGTAGFTAMSCVVALEDAGARPQDGEVVMTGASGGADSTAVALLYRLGYQVVTISGRESTHEYLKSLGANRILPRDESTESCPLEKRVWAGAIDTVGDKVLAKVLAQMNYGGCVAAYDPAGGLTLPTAVMPFTLRNVRLQGAGSIMTPPARHAQTWQRLVADLPESFYTRAAKGISLVETPKFAEAITNSRIRGRTPVKVS